MTYLPILGAKDLGKTPQSTQESNTGVIAFNQLSPYFFRYNATYKANDVFVVDENLGLTPAEVVREANSQYIPEDIKYTGATPTYTADGSNINFTAGRKQESKGLSNMGATAATSLTTQAGGIAWVTNVSGSFWANHPRAFDQGSFTAPVIVGTRRFPGTATEATYTNFYYLGASIAGYPLYSSSMNYRAQGWRREGLTFSIDLTHGFLQTASGLLSNWYEEDIKIPQNGKNSFYYVHREKILNSPAFAVSLSDLDRKDVNGTLTALAATENAWHFVYLDPSTKLIYVVLWAGDTVTTNSNYKSDPVVIDAHAKTIIPSFLRENGVLLGCVAVQQGQTFDQTYFCQLYQYQPGSGATLHPSIPSPSDALYGGTLKAKDNIYELKFDYDGYLINIAKEVKNNSLFIYDKGVPRNIALADYETTNTSLINMAGMGRMVYVVATNDPSAEVLYFTFVDRFTYQDAGEKGKYNGSWYFNTGAAYPEYVQIAQIKGLGDVQYLPEDPTGPDLVYPIFYCPLQLVRQTANHRYTTLLYTTKIPGLNNKTQAQDGIYNYSDTLRSRRKSNGSSDSLVTIQNIMGSIVINDQIDIWSYITEECQILIQKLTALIGPSLVKQIKIAYELVKRAGLLADQTKVVWPIIGYRIDNNSPTDSFEYALLGSSCIHYRKSTGQLSLSPYALNNEVPIQPMDVVTLQSGDLTPTQAVLFFLSVRYNYGGALFPFLSYWGSIGYQVTETPFF